MIERERGRERSNSSKKNKEKEAMSEAGSNVLIPTIAGTIAFELLVATH
jgi:hypothetical protein